MGIVWRFHCEPSTLDWLSEWPHHTAMLPPSPLRRNRPAKVHVGHSKLPRSGFVQEDFTPMSFAHLTCNGLPVEMAAFGISVRASRRYLPNGRTRKFVHTFADHSCLVAQR